METSKKRKAILTTVANIFQLLNGPALIGKFLQCFKKYLFNLKAFWNTS